MKILLFGKNGQVGWELNRLLLPAGDVVALGRDDADLSKPDMLRKIIGDTKPDIIVNAAAYTAVDKAEDEEELAIIINGNAPGVMAEEARKLDALLVHYSTDYVFDGTKKVPYVESDRPNPVNAYGRSKLAGEEAIQKSLCDYLILRTSWVYSARGNNFLLKILQLAKERESLSIVDDQVGAPTWAKSIADMTRKAVSACTKEKSTGEFKSGVYHLAAPSCTNWFMFANKIIDAAAATRCSSDLVVKEILPISSKEFVSAVRRPDYSCLAIEKMKNKYGIIIPGWEDSVRLCVESVCQ